MLDGRAAEGGQKGGGGGRGALVDALGGDGAAAGADQGGAGLRGLALPRVVRVYSACGECPVLPLVRTGPISIQLDVPSRFVDVPGDYWAQPFSEGLVVRGAVSGAADATQRSGNQTTRGQISQPVGLALGGPIDTSAAPVFSDVAPARSFYR